MGKQSSARNRFMHDRLWDDRGQEWHKRFGWLSHDDIGRHVTTSRVGVHHYGKPVVWLSSSDGQRWWKDVRAYTQDGERAAASHDGEGFTYAAATWTSGVDDILVFEAWDC